MKVKSATITLCKKALYESVSTKDMWRFIKIFDKDYDLYERSGVPRNIAISNQNAANQIVNDIVRANRFIDFIEILVRVSTVGYMGRKYTIKHLRPLITSLQKEGFCFDEESGLLFENSVERASRNWGRLRDGDEQTVAVLRLDIVDNSSLVKKESMKDIDLAYKDMRMIVEHAVQSRFGRLWSWEGDGALAAFVFGPKERSVLMAGMEILNELFIYNKVLSPLHRDIKVRIAAHVGLLQYRDSLSELLKNQVISEVIAFEGNATAVDSFTVSPSLFMYIDDVMHGFFQEKTMKPYGKIRKYSVAMEKSL